MQVTVSINGQEYTRDVEPRLLLVHFLRDELGLTGTHWGCDTSNCGTCVVLMDGEPAKSCTVLAATAERYEITTVEGLERDGVLDPVQEGFREKHVREGDPAHTILDVTDEQHAELIVVGAGGTPGHRRLMLGGVAGKLAHNAQTSLLIVHPT
jgi:nucleotide-binding universal stress UspA family protein